MAAAKRTNPALWERVKAEVTEGAKGGAPGQWSARKAQMAVQAYKRAGGGYDEGEIAQDETDLHRWTGEEWGTKSGKTSGRTGERYLPKLVRMILTEEEYARTTKAKRGGTAQFVDQPEDIRKKAATIREDGPTRAMLLERAEDLGIEGPGAMDEDALLKAIEGATDRNGRARRSGMEGRTRNELMELAREREVTGRSRMTKAELVKALEE